MQHVTQTAFAKHEVPEKSHLKKRRHQRCSALSARNKEWLKNRIRRIDQNIPLHQKLQAIQRIENFGAFNGLLINFRRFEKF